MYALIRSVYQQCFGSQSYNICILGIQQTGKTALFNTIKQISQQNSEHSNASQTYKPTVGLNVYRYTYQQDRFMVWDLGGKSNIRKIWENYYSECHGVVFLLNQNISEGLQVLKNVATHQQMARIPFVIIVTRDSDKEVVQLLLKGSEYMSPHSYTIHSLSIDKFASLRTSIRDMLSWLYKNIKELHNSIKD